MEGRWDIAFPDDLKYESTGIRELSRNLTEKMGKNFN